MLGRHAGSTVAGIRTQGGPDSPCRLRTPLPCVGGTRAQPFLAAKALVHAGEPRTAPTQSTAHRACPGCPGQGLGGDTH